MFFCDAFLSYVIKINKTLIDNKQMDDIMATNNKYFPQIYCLLGHVQKLQNRHAEQKLNVPKLSFCLFQTFPGSRHHAVGEVGARGVQGERVLHIRKLPQARCQEAETLGYLADQEAPAAIRQG